MKLAEQGGDQHREPCEQAGTAGQTGKDAHLEQGADREAEELDPALQVDVQAKPHPTAEQTGAQRHPGDHQPHQRKTAENHIHHIQQQQQQQQ